MRQDAHKGTASVNRLPFGDPDGARADIEISINEFVSLDERHFASGIATSELDRTIRVIVGTKGSGKTVYLRRHQDSARKEDSVFASKIDRDVPSTNLVVSFCQSFNEEKVTEAWQSSWRIAIQLATASHLCSKKYFSTYIDQQALKSRLRHLIPLWKYAGVERSPYAELKDLIGRFQTETTFWEHVQSSCWDDLQTILGTELKKCPPIFMYLDASDEEFAHAPMEWHRCQKGLFYAVMRLLNQPGAISSRLHIVIAIRDIVYSSILQSEHQTRYINSPQISLLDWNRRAIEFFFDEKLKFVPDVYFSDSNTRDIQSFFGLKHIQNKVRGVEEDIKSYVVRHTRCLPRDVIQIGNAIAAQKLEHRQAGGTEAEWESHFRNIVSRMARIFGSEQIKICANQLSSHDAPQRSAKQNYAEFYTSNKEYVNSRSQLVHRYIRSLSRERFGERHLRTVDAEFQSELPNGVLLSTILWQNGLIGYRRRRDDARFTFYSLLSDAGFSMPESCHEYVLRSILIDAVGSLDVLKGPPAVET